MRAHPKGFRYQLDFLHEPSFGVAGSGSGSCFESYVNKKEAEQTITIFPANNVLKEKEGIIRLTNFKGFWYLKKISDNQTLVMQQIYGNPGGSIPAFMVNTVVTKGPVESFKELRKRVENLNKK